MNRPAKHTSDKDHDEGPSDTILVDRAKSGDQAAFRALFDKYRRRVYILAIGMVQNEDEALDVVQDGFIKAYRYLAKFEGKSSFYTWLYRIVSNTAIDHLRKRKRMNQVDFIEAIEPDPELANGHALLPSILGQDPAKALLRREIREKLNEALATLSPAHKQALVLREFEGQSYDQMAVAMKCSKGTVMSRLFHARKKVQLELQQLFATVSGETS